MKKFILVSLIFASALGLGGVIYYYQVLEPVLLGDITASFAHDVGDYVSEHDGALPSSWSEFSEWASENGSTWPEEQLKDRFIIHLPAQTDSEEIPLYIEITDKKIKSMEDFLNSRIHYAQISGYQLRSVNGLHAPRSSRH